MIHFKLLIEHDNVLLRLHCWCVHGKSASELDKINTENFHNEFNKFYEVTKKDEDLYITNIQVISKYNKEEDENKYNYIILVITEPNLYLFLFWFSFNYKLNKYYLKTKPIPKATKYKQTQIWEITPLNSSLQILN